MVWSYGQIPTLNPEGEAALTTAALDTMLRIAGQGGTRLVL
jgi:hypothetical protein